MFTVTLALGVIVVAAIALSPLYAGALRRFRSLRLSAAALTLGLAIPVLCVAAPGTATVRSELFLCSFALILIAALLAFGDGDDPDEPGEWVDDEPPWWPEFERNFRSYARRRPPVASR